ncbi:helix-turn-helix transcriptional regulator [Streptomyces sp. MP131-18]|uniref:helix-turn-helix domain-containing protein n=1 Tax=Streptomyces sp. MP131-18 TaxID=1857892 RepID=UPI0009A17993|nr:helix-turn-helix transcriptional regulator [Streptomyces sp. MP131-18]ONK13077.1 helix-turn-helix protein [Streptomyces sp. MP131-18]
MGDQVWEDGDMRAEKPRSYVIEGQWPYAVLDEEAPVAAHYGQEVALRVAEAMKLRGLTQEALARRADLGQVTISRVLQGEVYPDLVTLAKLEQALRADVYPTGLYRVHE